MRPWPNSATGTPPPTSHRQMSRCRPRSTSPTPATGRPHALLRPVANDFKVLYLQDYRPNPAGTYHPIWAVSTKDAASYTSMGEIIPCGGLKEQDAALGTARPSTTKPTSSTTPSTPATSTCPPARRQPSRDDGHLVRLQDLEQEPHISASWRRLGYDNNEFS